MRSKDPELMKKICAYIDHYYRDNHHSPTQREIAKAMNISPSSAYRYLTAMADIGMIDYNNGKVTATEQISKCSSDYVSAPLVGSIQCGDPEEEVEQVEEYVSLPSSIFGTGEFYILRARGRSMVDVGISSGDLVVISKQEHAEPGNIVVALDDNNQNTLKKFAGIDKKTGKAILQYQNENEYPEKEILVNELVVQGVAKHVIKAL